MSPTSICVTCRGGMILLITTRAPRYSTSSRIAPLTNVAVPTAQGLYLTARRSGTGMGVDVSSNGGSFLGKKTSWMFSHKSAPHGPLVECLARGRHPVRGHPRTGYRIGVPGVVQYVICHMLPLALFLPAPAGLPVSSGRFLDPGCRCSGEVDRPETKPILPLCVTVSPFVAAFVTLCQGFAGHVRARHSPKSHILRLDRDSHIQ